MIWAPAAVVVSEVRIEETREYLRREARSWKNEFQSSWTGCWAEEEELAAASCAEVVLALEVEAWRMEVMSETDLDCCC